MEKNQPNGNQHWQHERQGEFRNITNKGWGMDFLMIRDGFDHEVRPIADIGVRAEKNRAGTDGEYGSRMLLQKRVHIVRTGCAGQRAEKAKIRGRIVEHAGEGAASEKEEAGRR